jgi:hypothetical protein
VRRFGHCSCSSSSVGGCCGHCQPTGEGSPSGSGEGVE